MDEITLNFDINKLNVSLQPGDVMFYKSMTSGNIYMMGACVSFSGTTVTCQIGSGTPRPQDGDFIFFTKNPEINISGVLGHYASVKMVLTGNSKKELYAVNTEVFKSS